MRLHHLRRPSFALVAAAAFACLATVETTYAEELAPSSVTLSAGNLSADPQQPDPTAGQDPTSGTPAPPPINPVVMDFSGAASINAQSIALVSLAARQVQLAKTPLGAKQVAQTIIDEQYHWNATQVQCLDALWTGESHWNFLAHNYRSGAHGIAQALPPTKMNIVSLDWRSNPVTQIKWGLSYIKARYGSPCVALAKKRRSHYY
jgi:Transglycosylase SLT domain